MKPYKYTHGIGGYRILKDIFGKIFRFFRRFGDFKRDFANDFDIFSDFVGSFGR